MARPWYPATIRLNKLFKEAVNEEQIIETLAPIVSRFARERLDETERFGDFVTRVGIVRHGAGFWDLVPPGGQCMIPAGGEMSAAGRAK